MNEIEDDRDRLGEWLPGDKFQGQVNMRTLKTLLSRIDRRGFERSDQQMQFHNAFFRACGRVIYKDVWSTDKPEIMRAEGWTKSTPRFSIRVKKSHLNLHMHYGKHGLKSYARAQHTAPFWKDFLRRATHIFNHSPARRLSPCPAVFDGLATLLALLVAP